MFTQLSQIDSNGLEIGTPEKPYRIKFANNDALYLVLSFASHKSIVNKLLHDNRILVAAPQMLGFKHYRKSGSKFWTYQAGVYFGIAIPADKVFVSHEKGYSYPKVAINGETISLNVTGMGGGDGWADWVHGWNHAASDLPLRIVNKILAVAMPPEQVVLPFAFDGFRFDEGDAKQWQDLAIRHSLTLAPDMTVKVNSRWRIPYSTDNIAILEKQGAGHGGKHWLSKAGFIIKNSQLDYLETAKLNAVPLPDPNDFRVSRLPVAI